VAVAGLQAVTAVWLTHTHTHRERDTDRQTAFLAIVLEPAELKNDVKCQTFITITMLFALAVCGDLLSKQNGI